MTGTRLRGALLLAGVPTLLACLGTNIIGVTGDSAAVMPTAIGIVRGGSLRLDWYAALIAQQHAGRPLPVLQTSAFVPQTSAFVLQSSPFVLQSSALQPELPYYLRRTQSGVYSAYPVGMTIFALPVAAVAVVVGADVENLRVIRRLEKLSAAVLAAVSASLFLALATQSLRPAAALWLTAALALGSPLFSTIGQALWQHGGAVFALLIGLLLLRDAQLGTVRLLAIGALAGLAVACRFSAVVVLAPLLVGIALRGWRGALLACIAAGVVLAPVLAFYTSVYGSPLGPSDTQTAGELWTGSWLAQLAGVLISPGRGLLIYCPWLLLGVAALLPRVRSAPVDPSHADGSVPRAARGVFASLGVTILIQIAVVAAWGMWWGGHCFGPRLLSEAVVACAALQIPLLARLWERRRLRRAWCGLVVASIFLHTVAAPRGGNAWNNLPVDVDARPERLWDWRDPPILRFLEISATRRTPRRVDGMRTARAGVDYLRLRAAFARFPAAG